MKEELYSFLLDRIGRVPSAPEIAMWEKLLKVAYNMGYDTGYQDGLYEDFTEYVLTLKDIIERSKLTDQ